MLLLYTENNLLVNCVIAVNKYMTPSFVIHVYIPLQTSRFDKKFVEEGRSGGIVVGTVP